MKKWTYPLHFIDFETYLGAVPLFKGNRPNEEIAYQFSHHIGYEDGTWKYAGDFIKLDYVLLQAGRFNKLHTEAIRRASLKYCELDTLSMVRIWEYFKISARV
ncbi:MAG: DUF2779 domain-containing protein [Treponemataceae bacterium]|nr:DUF2779 domain-containing protein [Treponemataceae bacterium]